jgi:integrase
MATMARLAKLPTGYFWRGPYIWCRTDPITKKAVSTECQDFAALKQWTRKRERNSEDPRYAAAHKASLGVWVKKTVEAKRADKSEATVEYYEEKLGHFVRVWGEHRPLIDIIPDLCDSYVAQRRQEGATDHTIEKEISCLTQLLKMARRSGCYPHQIEALKPLDLAPHYKPRDRHLKVSEIIALRAACFPRMRALVSVAVCTGACLSEALKFDPKIDLDRTGNTWAAHIRGTKRERRNRVVPIMRQFRHWLSEVLPSLPLVVYKNNLRRDLLKACERADIDPCTPNDLRRTHASLLVACGVDKDVVRRLLGHTTSRMVEMIYGRIDPTELAALAEPHLDQLSLPAHTAPQEAIKVSEKTGRTYFAKRNKKRNSDSDSSTTLKPVAVNACFPDVLGANFEIRTRDLRFTNPETRTQETTSSAENVGYPARIRSDEVASILGTTVTENVTMGIVPTLASLVAAAEKVLVAA